jgi:tol-pal system protein YbgF
VQAYRTAHTKWRENDNAGCVDLFVKFLQTYPASEYADDATYWLADCYFKQGNLPTAVLRFDDLVRQYPQSDKAPDALYRQGEALLRMGHGTAAGNAFEKVVRNYPNSSRAPEAKRQLQLLGSR